MKPSPTFGHSSLAGTLISLDALYARKPIAEWLKDRDADYLIALKKNNKKDHAHVEAFFSCQAFGRGAPLKAAFDAFDETHGRLVRRRAFVTDDPGLIGGLEGWAGLTKVIAVETLTSLNQVHGGGRGKTHNDIRYFLTSAPLDGPALAAAVRDHWAIENSLHWVLDVGFREDECRVRHRNAAANLSVIRKIAINLVKAYPSKRGSLQGKRKAAGWDNNYMKKIIALRTKNLHALALLSIGVRGVSEMVQWTNSALNGRSPGSMLGCSANAGRGSRRT